ncbi:uncharacterized protein VTP21DRAFT_6154 [Calcarisporiella thermophila]|uniref:uncharacterized protein n=1 Tax=Calcarisporiella thermophila TaxID=911321 RepID=UPI0037440AF2
MKIACLQYDPHLGQVQRNQRRANQLLERFQPGDIDVLVLPEMAFTGYVFNDRISIYPYLEDSQNGASVCWAKETAKRLQAYVMVGYPQIVKGQSDVYYNSICLVDRTGQLVTNYQKSFLFETDERWASEGPGFRSVDVKELGRVGIGICMDLNPYKFQAPFHAFEFARFHRVKGSRLLLCSMAWLKQPEEEADEDKHGDASDDEIESYDDTSNSMGDLGMIRGLGTNNRIAELSDIIEGAKHPATSVMNYWALRLLPLYSNIGDDDTGVLVAVANRCGSEAGLTFCGHSCVMRLTSRGVTLLGYLGGSEEKVLVVEV